MKIDVLRDLQRSFGVHRKTGRALVARGAVTIGGESVRLEGLRPELAEVRGKALAIPSRNLLTYPWGSPSFQDGNTETATGPQLTLT